MPLWCDRLGGVRVERGLPRPLSWIPREGLKRRKQREMWLFKALIWLALTLAGLRLAGWYRRRQKFVEAVNKLPGPPNYNFAPILNHSSLILMLDMINHKLGTYYLVYHLLSSVHIWEPNGIVRFWMSWRPLVVLYAPETVEALLSSPSQVNKALEYSVHEPWIGEGLLTSKMKKWRVRRKILTPAFHFHILNDFLPIINEDADKLVSKLNQPKYLKEGTTFDIFPLIALCTLDTICETAMGTSIHSQDNENSPYVEAMHVVGEESLVRVIKPWLWPDWSFYLSKHGRRFKKHNKIMWNFTTNVILERKRAWQEQLANLSHSKLSSDMTIDEIKQSSFFTKGNKRLAFLDLLLHQHLTAKTLSLKDVQEEVATFLFAGHDTTAVTIGWTIYMLGWHQDIQERVRNELDQVLGLDPSVKHFEGDDIAKELRMGFIDEEKLKEIKYLDQVIKETQRLYPSVPFIGRNLTEDLVVDNKYVVPKGSTGLVLTHILHNNPRVYPKPWVWDPDRFSPENIAQRHKFSFVPFSAGPRNCIGQRYAKMELKVILAKVIRNYYIKSIEPRDKLRIVGELVLRSRSGIQVRLTPRFGRNNDNNNNID